MIHTTIHQIIDILHFKDYLYLTCERLLSKWKVKTWQNILIQNIAITFRTSRQPSKKKRERSVAKISTIPPPLRGTTTKLLILDYYEIANQIDETGASSAETTKTPLNTSVPESTVVVAEYIQIGCEAVNVILNTISRLKGKL